MRVGGDAFCGRRGVRVRPCHAGVPLAQATAQVACLCCSCSGTECFVFAVVRLVWVFLWSLSILAGVAYQLCSLSSFKARHTCVRRHSSMGGGCCMASCLPGQCAFCRTPPRVPLLILYHAAAALPLPCVAAGGHLTGAGCHPIRLMPPAQLCRVASPKLHLVLSEYRQVRALALATQLGL